MLRVPCSSRLTLLPLLALVVACGSDGPAPGDGPGVGSAGGESPSGGGSPAPGMPDVVTEVYDVPVLEGGARVRVSITRDRAFDIVRQPILLSYAPRAALAGALPSDDGIAARYVPRGYARAVADVLGTGESTGCPDLGGRAEAQSGVEVVTWLAGQSWSNGRVGMTGVGYAGTTAAMVAATGIPELAGVVVVAGLSHWYGYFYRDGVRYLGRGTSTAEGVMGFAGPGDAPAASSAACATSTHAPGAEIQSPDYTEFWSARDYASPAAMAAWRAPALVVHGWQDQVAKAEEALRLYQAIPVDDPASPTPEGAAFKRLWMSQESHADGREPGYETEVDLFWEATLKGDPAARAELLATPPVHSLGRTAAGPRPDADYRREAAWPPEGTKVVSLQLGRSFNQVPGLPSVDPVTSTGEHGTLQVEPADDGTFTWGSSGAASEELTLRDPLNRAIVEQGGQKVQGHGYVSLWQESEPLTREARLVGSAVLSAWVAPNTTGQHITPLLVEVLPDGTPLLVERGFLNLDYARGLGKADPRTGWQEVSVRFLPQDHTFGKGSRIALLLQSTNVGWAVPGSLGLVEIAMGKVEGSAPWGARLLLPLAGVDAAEDILTAR